MLLTLGCRFMFSPFLYPPSCYLSHPAEPPGDLTCTFTYAAQGGTNEQWQMSIEMSEDEQRFFCTISRPLGKSYIFFTEFKADVEGGKIQYSEAYSQAAAGGQKDVALKKEEYEVSETAVTHKPGGFHSELSKLVIVARSHHSEL
ncbi:myeloid-derived growth factor isoform X2 [Rhinatrema bivittatum]|uniref:myeloid-derived growth factor isoform X2 n=1 Tax=Rhinatrema bivittatum TaxID=194408 RepID=UPI001125F498|nr:myeloid-derived growth factor isoform X2 [Rhinatrema bivittatum]